MRVASRGHHVEGLPCLHILGRFVSDPVRDERVRRSGAPRIQADRHLDQPGRVAWIRIQRGIELGLDRRPSETVARNDGGAISIRQARGPAERVPDARRRRAVPRLLERKRDDVRVAIQLPQFRLRHANTPGVEELGRVGAVVGVAVELARARQRRDALSRSDIPVRDFEGVSRRGRCRGHGEDTHARRPAPLWERGHD